MAVWMARARGGSHNLVQVRPVAAFARNRDGLRTRDHDALCHSRTGDPRAQARGHLSLDGTQYEVRRRILRSLPVRTVLYLQGRAGLSLREHPTPNGKV